MHIILEKEVVTIVVFIIWVLNTLIEPRASLIYSILHQCYSPDSWQKLETLRCPCRYHHVCFSFRLPLCFRTGLSWWPGWVFCGRRTGLQQRARSYCPPAARPSGSPESGQRAGPRPGWKVPGWTSSVSSAPGEPERWRCWRSRCWQEPGLGSGWQGCPSSRWPSPAGRPCCQAWGCRWTLWTHHHLMKILALRPSSLQSCCCWCCLWCHQNCWLWHWQLAPAFGTWPACSGTTPVKHRGTIIISAHRKMMWTVKTAD